jgi:hypothetical protein
VGVLCLGLRLRLGLSLSLDRGGVGTLRGVQDESVSLAPIREMCER